MTEITVKNLAEAYLNNTADDILDLARTVIPKERVEVFEGVIFDVALAFAALHKTAETFHKTNGNLDRKAYAVTAKKELAGLGFSLAMLYYDNRYELPKRLMQKYLEETIIPDLRHKYAGLLK